MCYKRQNKLMVRLKYVCDAPIQNGDTYRSQYGKMAAKCQSFWFWVSENQLYVFFMLEL